jgi:PhzF family phenazine biosynthesis protein
MTSDQQATFVCAPSHPEADYRLRIFTPRSELPFAGHPTIGSAHAVLQNGLTPRTPGRLVQECLSGLVPLRVDDDRIMFRLPTCVHCEPTSEQIALAAAALGIAASNILRASVVDVGPVWFTLQLADAPTVIALQPDMEAIAALGATDLTGVTVFGRYPAGSAANLEVRSFAPSQGVPEDPVCGSGNGCVAALMQRDWKTTLSRYVATQGCCVGRDGSVHVHYAEDGAIWVGGSAVTCIEGTLTA